MDFIDKTPRQIEKEGRIEKFEIADSEYEDLENRFNFHPATDPEVGQRHQNVRNRCLHLATELSKVVPPGREKTLMITKIEEVMFWANAGIAREGGK
jgi:hypothetical protein